MNDDLPKTEDEWKAKLSPEQYHILREKGTEPAFSGAYYENHDEGIFHCAACGNPLFDSSAKFESGSGWPSYYQPISPNSVIITPDTSHGMARTEVTCGRCGSHLGHVFTDGPAPTGNRFCMNSAALNLEKKKE